jgi:hypothetical protein
MYREQSHVIYDFKGTHMKIISRISAVSFLILLFYASIPPCGTVWAQSPTPFNVEEFQQSKEWKKVEPRLQEIWLSAVKDNFPDQPGLLCFVRVRAPFDLGDRSFLISRGFSVQVVAGTIARGRLDIKDLPNIASLPFVESIKLATK